MKKSNVRQRQILSFLPHFPSFYPFYLISPHFTLFTSFPLILPFLPHFTSFYPVYLISPHFTLPFSSNPWGSHLSSHKFGKIIITIVRAESILPKKSCYITKFTRLLGHTVNVWFEVISWTSMNYAIRLTAIIISLMATLQ